MYKIESGIMPPPSGVGGRRHRYPFKEMKIGDSFHAPCDPGESNHRAQTRLTNAARSAYGAGGHVVTQVQPSGGVRVWRMK